MKYPVFLHGAAALLFLNLTGAGRTWGITGTSLTGGQVRIKLNRPRTSVDIRNLWKEYLFVNNTEKPIQQLARVRFFVNFQAVDHHAAVTIYQLPCKYVGSQCKFRCETSHLKMTTGAKVVRYINDYNVLMQIYTVLKATREISLWQRYILSLWSSWLWSRPRSR